MTQWLYRSNGLSSKLETWHGIILSYSFRLVNNCEAKIFLAVSCPTWEQVRKGSIVSMPQGVSVESTHLEDVQNDGLTVLSWSTLDREWCSTFVKDIHSTHSVVVLSESCRLPDFQLDLPSGSLCAKGCDSPLEIPHTLAELLWLKRGSTRLEGFVSRGLVLCLRELVVLNTEVVIRIEVRCVVAGQEQTVGMCIE